MVQTYCMFQLAIACLLPDYRLPPPPPVTDYPAVMVIYIPERGGINCDGDCSTVAMGPLTQDMYFNAGACHPDLYGRTVYFPAINFTMRCVDNGELVTLAYNEYYDTEVVYFEVLWDESDPPEWLYWLLEWEIVN